MKKSWILEWIWSHDFQYTGQLRTTELGSYLTYVYLHTTRIGKVMIKKHFVRW